MLRKSLPHPSNNHGVAPPGDMMVIFLGSIGGMLTMGIVGLFIGAVVLALGYKLLQGWMKLETPMPAACAK